MTTATTTGELGRYQLIELISDENCSFVYKAYDPEKKMGVTITLLVPAATNMPGFYQVFEKTSQELKRISHPNLAQVLDYGIEGENCYLVTETIVGKPLSEIAAGGIPWNAAVSLLAPIAGAIHVLHKANILCRDLAPSHIIIDEHQQPRLVKYGILPLLEDPAILNLCGTGAGMGAPEYQAPEQVLNNSAGVQSDIYVLGIILYELLTGAPPFRGESPMTTLFMQVVDPLPGIRQKLPGIPQRVCHVVAKATAKNPKDRYRNMHRFEVELRHLVKTKEQSSHKTPVWVWLVPLLLLFFLIVLTGSGYWVYQEFFRQSTSTITSLAEAIMTSTPRIVQATAVTSPHPSLTSSPTPHDALETSQKEEATPTLTQTVSNTTTPTPETRQVIDTVSPTPSPTLKVNPVLHHTVPKMLSLAGISLPNLSSTITAGSNISELARWGIGKSSALIWSKDGTQIVIATTAGIFFYDAQTLDLVDIINTIDHITSLSFSIDGKVLAIGTKDGDVIIWDMEGWKIAYTLSVGGYRDQVYALAFSGNGKYFAVGAADSTIHLYDITNFSEIKILVDMALNITDGVYCLDFSKDSRFLVSGSGDHYIRIWDITTKKLYQPPLKEPQLEVTNIFYSADGNYLVAASKDGRIRIWNTTTSKLYHSFALKNLSVIAISPDSKTLASGSTDGNIQLWDISNRKAFGDPIKAHPDSILGLRFSPDGKTLASTSWREPLVVRDARSGEKTNSIGSNITHIGRTYYAPDNKYLATEINDQKIKIWDAKTGDTVTILDGYFALGEPFSPNSRYMVSVNQVTGNQIDLIVWETATWKKVRTFNDPVDYWYEWQVNFSPDSNLLISGMVTRSNRHITIWEISTGWQKLNIEGIFVSGCQVAYSPPPDHQQLLALTDVGVMMDWNGKTEHLCGTHGLDFAKTYLISPDRKWVSLLYLESFGGAYLWDMESPLGRGLAMSGIHNIGSDISDILAFSPDNRLIAMASQIHNALYLYPVSTNSTKYTEIKEYNEYHYQSAFSRDAQYLALGCEDGTVRIWGQEVR